MNPRDDLASIVNVRGPCDVVGDEVAVFGENVHHGRLVVLHGKRNEVFKTVGHVAILGVWSND